MWTFYWSYLRRKQNGSTDPPLKMIQSELRKCKIFHCCCILNIKKTVRSVSGTLSSAEYKYPMTTWAFKRFKSYLILNTKFTSIPTQVLPTPQLKPIVLQSVERGSIINVNNSSDEVVNEEGRCVAVLGSKHFAIWCRVREGDFFLG